MHVVRLGDCAPGLMQRLRAGRGRGRRDRGQAAHSVEPLVRLGHSVLVHVNPLQSCRGPRLARATGGGRACGLRAAQLARPASAARGGVAPSEALTLRVPSRGHPKGGRPQLAVQARGEARAREGRDRGRHGDGAAAFDQVQGTAGAAAGGGAAVRAMDAAHRARPQLQGVVHAEDGGGAAARRGGDARAEACAR